MENKELVPSYGLLVIISAYNEGKVTFDEFVKLMAEWSAKMVEQAGSEAA